MPADALNDEIYSWSFSSDKLNVCVSGGNIESFHQQYAPKLSI